MPVNQDRGQAVSVPPFCGYAWEGAAAFNCVGLRKFMYADYDIAWQLPQVLCDFTDQVTHLLRVWPGDATLRNSSVFDELRDRFQ